MPARPTWNLPWLLAVLVGAALRLHQITDQVLVDDEWHALHTILAGGPLDVLLSFGASDHSIPLTLYDVLLERTVGLSELGMRLPSLVAGIAALVIVPALLRDVAGRRASVTLAWLLAIAPLHVFYSRYARPYEPAMLASFVALVGLYRTTSEDRRWLWWTSLAGALLAPWLLPVVLPLVATPLALVVLRTIGGRRSPRPARADLLGVALVLAGWLVLLGAPLAADAGALTAKVGRGTLELATVLGASELLLGTPSVVLRLACGAALLGGAAALVRCAPRFAAWLGLAAAAQLAALLVAAPHGLRFAIVLARYALALSPFLLWMIALGLGAADQALAARMRWRRVPVLSTAAVAALIATGPLAWIHAWPNDFTNHASYQADYLPGRYFERFRPVRISAFYDTLARQPAGSLTVVEAPWYFYWHGLAYLQRIHRQHVVVGFVDPATGTVRSGEVPRGRDGIRLRNALHVGDRAALRARGVDYVIFHRDAFAEMRVPFEDARVGVDAWLDEYRRIYGAPAFTDESITVFAVRRD